MIQWETREVFFQIDAARAHDIDTG